MILALLVPLRDVLYMGILAMPSKIYIVLALLVPLRDVLYMGILAMPSKIYIVINYKGRNIKLRTFKDSSNIV